jgi:flagellar basal-body rod modification protein FlgD
MTSPTNPFSAPAPAAHATSSSPPGAVTDPLANANVFLKLLVAQLENQDPESPADGTQFITQLAQFSTLSNSAQMLSDLDAIKQSLSALGTSKPASGASSTS